MNQKKFTDTCARAHKEVRRKGDRTKGVIAIAIGTKSLSVTMDGEITIHDIQVSLNAVAQRALKAIPDETIEAALASAGGDENDEGICDTDSGTGG